MFLSSSSAASIRRLITTTKLPRQRTICYPSFPNLIHHQNQQVPKVSSRLIGFSFSSGIDKIAENKILEWMNQGGVEGLKNKQQQQKNKNKKGLIKHDYHKELSNSLGVGHDYIHSKMLADNNIRPESIERRIRLDKEWELLQLDIKQHYQGWYLTTTEHIVGDDNDYFPTPNLKNIDNYIQYLQQDSQQSILNIFQKRIQQLNQISKLVNDAIISDSLRFNGRSPVPHARPFHLEERIYEAITGTRKRGTKK